MNDIDENATVTDPLKIMREIAVTGACADDRDKKWQSLRKAIEAQATLLTDCKIAIREQQESIRAGHEELAKAKQWINDLQSGMYINCVYCGHRYGPESEVPASMSDALKEHIEQCHEHPMSKCKKELAQAQARIERLEHAIDYSGVYKSCQALSDVLHESPRQSHAAVKAEALREFVKLKRTELTLRARFNTMVKLSEIEQEAYRIEREAKEKS